MSDGPFRRTRVYVACAYTNGVPVHNVRRAVLLGDELWDKGYAPYVPHMTMLWDLVSPKPADVWYQMDLQWLRACDVLLWDLDYCPGESFGAKEEVLFALDHNIPVYRKFADFLPNVPAIQLTQPGGSAPTQKTSPETLADWVTALDRVVAAYSWFASAGTGLQEKLLQCQEYLDRIRSQGQPPAECEAECDSSSG